MSTISETSDTWYSLPPPSHSRTADLTARSTASNSQSKITAKKTAESWHPVALAAMETVAATVLLQDEFDTGGATHETSIQKATPLYQSVLQTIRESKHLRHLEDRQGIWRNVIHPSSLIVMIKDLDAFLDQHMRPNEQVSHPAPLIYGCLAHRGIPYAKIPRIVQTGGSSGSRISLSFAPQTNTNLPATTDTEELELQRIFDNTKKTALTKNQMNLLFKFFKNSMPIQYQKDGCHVRAHWIAHCLEQLGIDVQIAWIEVKSANGPPLGAKSETASMKWGMHTAPIVEVLEDDDSKDALSELFGAEDSTERMVLDMTEPEPIRWSDWISRLIPTGVDQKSSEDIDRAVSYSIYHRPKEGINYLSPSELCDFLRGLFFFWCVDGGNSVHGRTHDTWAL